MLRRTLFTVASLALAAGCSPNVVSSNGQGSSATSSSTGSAGSTTGAAGTTSGSSGSSGTVGSGSTGATGSTGAGSTGGSSGSSGGTTTGSVRDTYPNPPYAPIVLHVINNYSLTGYLTNGLSVRVNTLPESTFSFQDVRQLKRDNGQYYRYMLLMLGGTWCYYCNVEADDVKPGGASASKPAEWQGKGGLLVNAVVQDDNYNTPTQAVLDAWINNHDLHIAAAMDDQGTMVADGLDFNLFPTNLVINLDTMKIEASWSGFDSTYAKWEAALNN
jgi:hypothetical protein